MVDVVVGDDDRLDITDAYAQRGRRQRDFALTAALAQQRYYSSYGTSTPRTATARPVTVDTDGGIATLPFALALAGALIVGIVAAGGLHALHTRRRRRADHAA